MVYYLAIDIGASGGRHILGHLENGRLVTEEIYRFENGVEKDREGSLVWNTEKLFSGIMDGLMRCKQENKIPATVAIDTWGVDYCLLDKSGQLIGPAYSYRDTRRAAVVPAADALLSREEVYRKTGIQYQPFNTLYQLFCDQTAGRLDRAEYFLQMPDYLAWRLTGNRVNEYTNATTTSLVNAAEKIWDRSLIEKLGLKASLFGKLTLPAESIGRFSPETEKILGFSAEVLTAPSHDTASAFAASLGLPHAAVLSSGTWSLIGMERSTPLTTQEAMRENFTNEGGIEFRYRFLKNIMGMWLLQNIRRETGKQYSYDRMMQLAQSSSYRKIFDVNDPSLSAPESMISAIQKLLCETSIPLPDLLSSVYHSLAFSYRRAVESLEALTGERVSALQIVGGGSSDDYLNRLTKEALGIPVLAGPKEATAIGNLASQIMHESALTLAQVREIIRESFDVRNV